MMAGSVVEDVGAPDSWESTDLDESMKRLMVSSSSSSSSSSKKRTDLPSPASTSPSEFIDSSDDPLTQVDQFLVEALDKPRERISILRIEQEIIKFISDPSRQQLEFEDLPTSYLRLAAHRVAQHYYLQSFAMPENILPDGSGSRIVLRKTSYCKLPPVRLADIPNNLHQEENKNVIKVAIKQRPQKTSRSNSSSDLNSSNAKSVEERKEEYNKARTRIFSSGGGSIVAKPVNEPRIQENILPRTFIPARPVDPSFDEDPKFNLPRDLSDSFRGGSRMDRNRGVEQDPAVSRYRASNRVAIFRDREVDRNDPDYDRSYDRYMQRFDPGFGFNGGHYTVQPLYSPTVNYNMEFPQLGASHRPLISIDHQTRPPIRQHIHGPWPTSSSHSPVGYGSPECMIPSFNPSLVGTRPSSSLYMHSSQYPGSPRPGSPFVHWQEHVQPFPQSHQQQSEPNFGLARPR